MLYMDKVSFITERQYMRVIYRLITLLELDRVHHKVKFNPPILCGCLQRIVEAYVRLSSRSTQLKRLRAAESGVCRRRCMRVPVNLSVYHPPPAVGRKLDVPAAVQVVVKPPQHL